MKFSVNLLILTISLIFSTALFAQDKAAAPATPLSTSAILAKLAKMGYSNAFEVDTKNGGNIIKVEGLDKNNQQFEVYVDAYGNLVSQNKYVGNMNALEIASQLESEGFTIREIDLDNGLYEVKASNAQGQYSKVYLDPKNGNAIPHN